MHDRDPNAKGLNRAPFLARSKNHSPVSRKSLTAHCDSYSSTGCIRIQLTPSALQPLLRRVGLLGSNIANTGEDVTLFFNLLDNSINAGAQEISGIGFL